MIKVNDKWFRLLVIILPVMIVVITSGAFQFPLKPVKLCQFLVSVCSVIIICEGVRFIIYKGRAASLEKKRKMNTNWVVIVTGLIFTTIVLALSRILKTYIVSGKLDALAELNTSLYINARQINIDLGTYSFSNACINFFFLYACYKGLFHYARLKHTEQAKEVLEKEKLKAELQQLKGIVNPHFLFNNLNSLSSLISEDPARAEVFLDELTKVFRYLLRNNNTELITLAAELQFIQSYYHLLQMRYGKSIEMEITVKDEYAQLQLPPLTLQLLLENAVKHNQLQKNNPLQISLFAAPGNKLVMQNNIIKKSTPVESTGIGLQSINARYAMLNKPGINTEQTEEKFSVIIPLLS